MNYESYQDSTANPGHSTRVWHFIDTIYPLGAPGQEPTIPGLIDIFSIGVGGSQPTSLPTSSDSWVEAVSGSWTTAANWTDGVPDSSTDATIAVSGKYTVTVNGAANANSLTIDDGRASVQNSGTLNINADIAVSAGTFAGVGGSRLTVGGISIGTSAILELNGSESNFANLTVDAGGFTSNLGTFLLSYTEPVMLGNSFTNGGLFAVIDHSALTITGSLTNSGTLFVDQMLGSDGYGGSNLTIGGVLSNTGTVWCGPSDNTLSAPMTVSLGGLVNSSKATFEIYGSSSSFATLSIGTGGFTSNDGKFLMSYTAPVTLSSSFTNSDLFAVIDHSALTITGSLTNSGTLFVDQMLGSDGYGGSKLAIGGVLSNTGTVWCGPSDNTLSAPMTVSLGGLVNSSKATFEIYGSSSSFATLSIGTGGFTSNDGKFLMSYTAPVTLSSSFTNSDLFAVIDHSALTITGSLTNSGTLFVDQMLGSDGYGGSKLAIGGVLSNTGTVWCGPSDNTLSAPMTVSLGGLVNSSKATFEIYGSSNDEAKLTISGSTNNSGTLDLGTGATFDAGGLTTNSGNINIGSGSLLNVSSGNAFTQNGGKTVVQGTFTSPVINIDGGVLSFETTNFTNDGTLTAADGGLIDFSAGGLTNFSEGTLTEGTFVVDARSTLQLPNNSPITTLAADLTLSGTLSVVESASSGGGQQQIDNTLSSISSDGTLLLLSGRNYTTSQSINDSGLLQLGGVTFQATSLNVGPGGTLTGYGTVNNAVSDTGSVSASGGTLVMGGALNGVGVLSAVSGATVELTTGGALTESISGLGTLQLDGTTAYTLALNSNTAIATVAIDAGATLSGAGTLGGAVTDAGTVSATGGTLLVDGAMTGNGALTAAANAVLDLAGGGSFGGNISGAGTLQLDGTTAFTLLAGATLSIAHVVIDGGATLDLTGGGSLSGSYSGTGTLQLDGATPFTISAGATLTVGTLNIDAGATLSGAGAIDAALIDSGSLTATGGTLIVAGPLNGSGVLSIASAATLDLTGGGALTQAISGSGTLRLDGATAYTLAGGTVSATTLAVDNGATLSGVGTLASNVTDAGTIIASGGVLTLIGATSGKGALIAQSGAVLDLTAGGALGETISGTGTLQLDGTNAYTLSNGKVSINTLKVDTGATLSGTGTITGSVTDAGTITASGGLLKLTGSLDGSGALSAAKSATLDLTAGGSLSETISGAGTLQLDSASYILSGGTVAIAAVAIDAGATLSGSGTIIGALMDSGSLIVNSGILDLTGGGSFAGSATGGGTLQLDGAASFTMAGGNLAVGTVKLDAGATVSGFGAITGSISDAGAIAATGGMLVLSGPLTGSGALQATVAGATLDLIGGDNLTETISGAGTLQLDEGTYTLSGATVSIGSVAVDAGATLSGTGTMAGTGGVTDAGTVNASNGTLLVNGAVTGTGTLSAAVGAVLDLAGGGSFAGGITGQGTLQLDGANAFNLDGGTVAIGTLNVDAGATLSGTGTISSVVADAGTIIATGGRLVLSGSVSGAGALQAAANATLDLTAGGALTQAVSGAGTLELGGVYALGSALNIANLAIDAGASLTGVGDLASILVDSGTVAAQGGTLTLSGALSGSGTLSAAAGAVLDLVGGGSFAGAITGAGTVRFDAATALDAGASLSAANVIETANLTLGSGVNLTNGMGENFAVTAATKTTVALSGANGDSFTNNGALDANGKGTADIGLAFINAGNVSVTSGKLAFLGAVTNNGIIDASAGVISIKSDVSGTGTLDIGATGTLTLLHGAKSGQMVDFQATTGLLDLSDPISFAGTITGFGGTDFIDLIKTAEASWSFSGGVLTVMNNKNHTVAAIHFNGDYTQSNFNLTPDGHNGTLISYVPPHA